MQNPERLGSRVAFENRWVRLLLDRLRLGDGMEIDYTYIARPRYAIAAAVEDGRIWMVEQYRHPLGRRSWELPMGVAPGVPEDRMDEAAAVELREETGVRAARFDYVGEVAPAPALLAQTGALYPRHGPYPGRDRPGSDGAGPRGAGVAGRGRAGRSVRRADRRRGDARQPRPSAPEGADMSGAGRRSASWRRRRLAPGRLRA
jgi:hypothetical protein